MVEKTKIKENVGNGSKKKLLKAESKEAGSYDPWNVLLYPSMSEKSIRMIEEENKIVFIVRQDARKHDVKKAFEKAFAVKVLDVKTLLDQKSRKKAFIRISKEFLASDIATRLGII